MLWKFHKVALGRKRESDILSSPLPVSAIGLKEFQ